jgi:hypothetical protein
MLVLGSTPPESRLCPSHAAFRGAKMRIGRIVGAAFAYASSVFIIGFALGAIRVLFLAPRIGSTLAVSIEAPVMLVFSWAIMKWIGPRLALPATPAAMVVLGLLAFGLLQLYEFSLAIFVFGRALRETLASFGVTAGAIRLAAQVAFGLIPVLQFVPGRSQSIDPQN